jgi:hypothetical protein
MTEFLDPPNGIEAPARGRHEAARRSQTPVQKSKKSVCIASGTILPLRRSAFVGQGCLGVSPYLADFRDRCGDVFEPAFCLFGCFLLIAFGVWIVMCVARNRNPLQALSAVLSGAIVVAAALSDGVFPRAIASRMASLKPRFRLI